MSPSQRRTDDCRRATRAIREESMSIKNTEPVQAETHGEASAQQQTTDTTAAATTTIAATATAAATDTTAATADNQPSLHKSL